MGPRLIANPEDVTAEWLTEVLAAAGVLPGGEAAAPVAGFETEAIGTGQLGANIRYRLSYAGDPGGGAPASVVIKFASRDEVSRQAGIQTRTYETEVAFYRDIAHTVAVSRPQCYLADIVPGTADVVLVMEDLAPAAQGDQIAGCTVEQARLVVEEAAKLHGPRWQDLSLKEIPWLGSRTGGGAVGAPLVGHLWDGFVERYRATLSDEAIAVGERFKEAAGGFSARAAGEPFTVVHNDYRLDNMLFATPAGGRPVTIVDWQTVQLGVGTADVAYFLGAGLATEERRAHERDLVAAYHRALTGYGIDGYSFDECWEHYRRYSYSGFIMAVIASMLVGRTDRGDAMFMAMANRHASQIADLAAEELL